MRYHPGFMTDLWEVCDMSLADGHVLRFLSDVSVNDQNVGELSSEA